jgi:hypothetical protein
MARTRNTPHPRGGHDLNPEPRFNTGPDIDVCKTPLDLD